MKIIPPSAFVTMPWKNGGGITHEVAKEEEAGRLLWRLSVAEVGSDGPFSAFPGLSRILTVIDGEGLELQAPDGALQALPLAPVAFSGDTPIISRRFNGPVRDFNVIFDGRRIAASLRVAAAGEDLAVMAEREASHALYFLTEGTANSIPIAAGSLVQVFSSCAVHSHGPVILVRLARI
ncbi:MAG: HutD family protein [Alphaproteobacteria bacterium]|nr:HutD family protein [Alphaproteobacteria bacterium]